MTYLKFYPIIYWRSDILCQQRKRFSGKMMNFAKFYNFLK